MQKKVEEKVKQVVELLLEIYKEKEGESDKSDYFILDLLLKNEACILFNKTNNHSNKEERLQHILKDYCNEIVEIQEETDEETLLPELNEYEKMGNEKIIQFIDLL